MIKLNEAKLGAHTSLRNPLQFHFEDVRQNALLMLH